MFETLEDRVKFEKTDQGVRIAVPVRRGPFAAIYGPLVALWLVVATVRYWDLLAGPHVEGTNFNLQMIAIGIYAFGFIYFMCWLAWTMTGETVVTLNPPEVRIASRVFGVDLSVRTFHTDQIHRMRFVEAKRMATQRSVLNPNSSYIRFEVNDRARKFAKGVSKDEARALIDKMLQVYQFPRSWF
jgi:hypothetical protein